MKKAILSAVLACLAAGAHAQPASIGAAIDGFLDDADATIGVTTRDVFVRSMVTSGFRCKSSNDPSMDVMCAKAGVGQAARFGQDGTINLRKVALFEPRDCKLVREHLEARFSEPDIDESFGAGWFWGSNRLLSFYPHRDSCEVGLGELGPK